MRPLWVFGLLVPFVLLGSCSLNPQPEDPADDTGNTGAGAQSGNIITGGTGGAGATTGTDSPTGGSFNDAGESVGAAGSSGEAGNGGVTGQ